MRTIILTLLLLTAALTKAQSFDRAVEFQSGTWNDYTQKWMWDDTKVCDIQVTFHGNTVLVADAAKSAYRTGKVFDKTDNQKESSTTWKAFDEAGRSCMLTLTYYKNTKREVLMVMYNNTCYVYRLANTSDETPLSNL